MPCHADIFISHAAATLRRQPRRRPLPRHCQPCRYFRHFRSHAADAADAFFSMPHMPCRHAITTLSFAQRRAHATLCAGFSPDADAAISRVIFSATLPARQRCLISPTPRIAPLIRFSIMPTPPPAKQFRHRQHADAITTLTIDMPTILLRHADVIFAIITLSLI